MAEEPSILETDRLKLKPVELKDIGPLYDFLIRNYDFFKPWSPSYGDDYRKIESQKARVENLIKEYNAGRSIKFCIYKHEEPTKIIGALVLSNIIKGPFLSCYLGYRIDEKENGKGFATEAIKKVIDYAFEALKLHRIEANIMPRNKASIRVVEKLGFTYEGSSKKYLKMNGVWEDHLHYVLLNESVE